MSPCTRFVRIFQGCIRADENSEACKDLDNISYGGRRYRWEPYKHRKLVAFQHVSAILPEWRMKLFIWAASWQNQQNGMCAQRRLRSTWASARLIRFFAVRMKKPRFLSYPLSAQRRLLSDWPDAQADLSLRWAHSHFVGFVTMQIILAAPSEFGTYRICEQRRFRRACASAQSRQNLRCSLIQAVSQEEPSDGKPDPWPFWMAGHAQLKFVMTECSKTQIRLTRPICWFNTAARVACNHRLNSICMMCFQIGRCRSAINQMHIFLLAAITICRVYHAEMFERLS